VGRGHDFHWPWPSLIALVNRRSNLSYEKHC
jgi:hypothetical protein